MTELPINQRKLMVPMHVDNWALALASGYIGTNLRDDIAVDVQSLVGGAVLAFCGCKIPHWAIKYGDDGPRVVLELSVDVLPAVEDSEFVTLPGLLRSTNVVAAHFQDEGELRNFFASYSLFPDVPVRLIPATVGGFSVDAGADNVGNLRMSEHDISARRALEYFGGWSGGLFEALLSGRHDRGIQVHLQNVSSTPSELACSLLNAMHPTATNLDRAIWGTVVAVLYGRASQRGFDKSDVLDEVADKLAQIDDAKEQAQPWLTTCSKVVRSMIEPPPLDDQRRIGQRAALAALLAPDGSSVSSLTQTLGAGPIVQLLAMVASRAFNGLSRLDVSAKNSMSSMSALLATAEAIAAGRSVELAFSGRSFDPSFWSHDEVLVNGVLAFTRSIEPRSHELVLRARASEAGLLLNVDPETRGIYFAPKGTKEPKIFIEEAPESTAVHPIVRFVVLLGRIGNRSSKQLQQYLEAAWLTGCAVGLRDDALGRQACAFALLPTATLDRDEFSFHLNRLMACSEAVSPTRKRTIKQLQQVPS